MKYKTDKISLLFLLYNIEDKRQYNCKNITKKLIDYKKRCKLCIIMKN